MPSVAAAEIARMRESVFFEGPELGRRLSRFWILLVLAAITAVQAKSDLGPPFGGCFPSDLTIGTALDGGEIFVPKLPSLRVMDVAEALAPTAERRIIGIRRLSAAHTLLRGPPTREHRRMLAMRAAFHLPYTAIAQYTLSLIPISAPTRPY